MSSLNSALHYLGQVRSQSVTTPVQSVEKNRVRPDPEPWTDEAEALPIAYNRITGRQVPIEQAIQPSASPMNRNSNQTATVLFSMGIGFALASLIFYQDPPVQVIYRSTPEMPVVQELK